MWRPLGTSQNLSWGGGGWRRKWGVPTFFKGVGGGPESFEDKLRGGN